MNNRDFKYFNKRLNEWLDVLLYQKASAVNKLQEYSEQPIEDIDRANMESERSLSLRIKSREKFLIRKIEQSLRDIESGDYGICEACGGRIAVKRLKVRPVTRHCIECKTEMEIRERLVGD
jgi:DnaK suppressor protein